LDRNSGKMTGSARFSMLLEPELKEWLEEEARRRDRSAGYVAAQAIALQKARSEARRHLIEDAVAEANEGDFISAEKMNAWFASLGAEDELPEPEADVFLRRK
jgi:predicted transcriptional regulator